MEFHAPVFQELLRRLDRGSLVINNLRFVINGQSIVFGRTKFAIMLGLKFKGFQPPPVVSSFHERVFGGNRTLTLDDIKTRFDEECKSSNGSGFVCRQLTMLSILYGTLLSTGRITAPIDMTFFHPIDDLAAFDAYPWGLISPGDIALRGEVDAPGFTFALLLWAYEVMPQLASACARRRGSDGDLIPQIRAWKTNAYIDRVRIKEILSDHRGFRLQLRMRIMTENVNEGGSIPCPNPSGSRGRGTHRGRKRKCSSVSVDFDYTSTAPLKVALGRGRKKPLPCPPDYFKFLMKAVTQPPTLVKRSVPPQPMHSLGHRLSKPQSISPISANDTKRQVRIVAERLSRMEELFQSICRAPSSSTTPLLNPTRVFSSLSPEYSGLLPDKEPRSIHCRRLSFDDMSPEKR
ncbi:hypothetical protein C2S51_007943 [Perilla frutescens var. frutescens]|nr:hypothetical protein C2S51_007943 [Perilla frutescens var. frutescens]